MDIISYDCACEIDRKLRYILCDNSIFYKKCYGDLWRNEPVVKDYSPLSSEATLCALNFDELRRVLALFRPSEKVWAEFEGIGSVDVFAYKLLDYIKDKTAIISTSNFDNLQNHLQEPEYFLNGTLLKRTAYIGIAGLTPEWFNEKLGNDANFSSYPALAPKYEWRSLWRDNNLSNEWYQNQYYKTVLAKLDPQKVYDDLTCNETRNAVFLKRRCKIKNLNTMWYRT